MKDIELKEVDQTKQLMTRENGCVKVTVPENTAVKYTGLSKDELVKVAGTPGWIRIRWALLALFFLGWVGMLAGAIVIIVQAPRCKPIPEMHWWNEGPLYQISDVNAFTESGLKGLEGKLDYLSQMNVAGVVLGPIHSLKIDQLDTLNLISVQSEVGTENELESLLGLAHKKGIFIVLNLTPNFNKTSAWFNNFNAVAEKIKDACTYWLDKGLDGIFLSDLNEIPTDAWPSIKEIFNRSDATKEVALMGSVNSMSVNDISVLLNRSGVDLLLTGQPDLSDSGEKQAQIIKEFNSSIQQTSLGWRSRQDPGTLAAEFPIRLYQILLFTLPGTPVFSAGEELGLKAEEQLQALWDLENPVEEKNAKAKALQEERLAVRNFFKTLSDLRGKERSLQHGEYVGLSNSKSSLAFLRVWDQSKRFITALNWGDKPVTMKLTYRDLPAEAQVLLSTDTSSLALESMVSLEKLQLDPKQAVLLTYSYAG
ncbi:uncharacterized protein LOC790938 [Danio rerio]|uniref:Uncharacterized protein LOC790938 n=1 Tax=Danio rerio TaxID=7955 RepID=A1A5Y9_DANRE|nr:uncharacterized protein LOC790938 [Danio rerio]AAI28866.1 Zgc:158423 [Danio rerio]|eukprot:NP_001073552.1 uncharacterized protein LOC790938 [Danio rerio]